MTDFLQQSLLLGFLLDALIGDPYWLPHPIRWFGHAINRGEQWLNRGRFKKLKGALLSAGLITLVWILLYCGLNALKPFETTHRIITVLLVFYGLANHSLIAEALKVERKLTREGLEAGRKQLSFIVGRDTTSLSEHQIRTAVLETLAENLSDGVIAPLFYYTLGGVPLMLTYKMVNTLDSMIGYKTERYREFGWFAARTDDCANYIPARITAVLMVLVTFSARGFRFLFKYGRHHASPNSGYPEAALAGILNTRFGGPNIYHGQLVEKPYIGDQPRQLTRSDLYKACLINAAVACIAVAIVCLIEYRLTV